MENPFEFHEEDTIIACVGDNGGTTDEDILTDLQLRNLFSMIPSEVQRYA